MTGTLPTIAAIIPTPGQGRPLKRCLTSIAPQLAAGDEVWVIGDTYDAPDGLPEVARLVADYGPQFQYVPFNGGQHSYGHFEINHGIALATADYLTFNDDDDVYVPDAFETIRAVAGALVEPRPLMFKFFPQFRLVLWQEPEIKQDWIGGHNIVAPNIKDRLGAWTDRYQGDYDFIRSTVDLWPNKDADVVWRPELIAVARPETVVPE